MARGEVFLDFDDGHGCRPDTYSTDLTGYGQVAVGEEFTVREKMFGRLLAGGFKARVRVKAVEARGRSFHVLHVEVLEDLTPQPTGQREMF
jgi:hypothetical protein